MSRHVGRLVLLVGIMIALAGTAGAQTAGGDGWKVTVYPLIVWVPVGIGIDVSVPPEDGSGGGGGKVIDTRFDGAYLLAFGVSNGTWRIDADGLWAAVGGDRADRPQLSVDLSAVYGHATGGFRIYKDLSVTGGFRRLALKYDIKLADNPTFTRKPGVWDPLVGLRFDHVAEKVEQHGVFEGGGFGVGSDTDLGGSLRADWKPWRHFGLTAGYTFLHVKVSDTVASRTFTAKQTIHGPLLGIGLYF